MLLTICRVQKNSYLRGGETLFVWFSDVKMYFKNSLISTEKSIVCTYHGVPEKIF